MITAKKPHGWLLAKIWYYMHFRVYHNERNIYPGTARRWERPLRRFEEHHMAERGLRTGRTTARFVNRYTAHRWM